MEGAEKPSVHDHKMRKNTEVDKLNSIIGNVCRLYLVAHLVKSPMTAIWSAPGVRRIVLVATRITEVNGLTAHYVTRRAAIPSSWKCHRFFRRICRQGLPKRHGWTEGHDIPERSGFEGDKERDGEYQPVA